MNFIRYFVITVFLTQMTASGLFLSTANAQVGGLRAGQIEVEAGSSLDVFGEKKEGEEFGDTIAVEDTYLRLKCNITREIRLLLMTRFDAEIRERGISLPVDFDIEKFIWSAFIEIREVAGQPVAIIVGKHRMAFGFNQSKLPTESDFGIGNKVIRTSQVFGVTVRLDRRLIEVLDTAEVSFFETGKGDLRLGEFDGVAVRVTKRVMRNIRVTGSYRYQGFGSEANKDPEHTFGLAVVYEDGRWTAWVEGLGFVDNNRFPNAGYALIIGVARYISIGELSAEFQFVENHFEAYRVGLKVPVTKNVSIGPEARYIANNEGRNGFAVGARVQVQARTRINVHNKRKNVAGRDLVADDRPKPIDADDETEFDDGIFAR